MRRASHSRIWGAKETAQGVGGGAWFPPAQGALADKSYTRHSYLVPLAGFTAMTTYAMYIFTPYVVVVTTTDPQCTAVSSSTRRSSLDSTLVTVAQSQEISLQCHGPWRDKKRTRGKRKTGGWRRLDGTPHRMTLYELIESKREDLGGSVTSGIQYPMTPCIDKYMSDKAK